MKQFFGTFSTILLVMGIALFGAQPAAAASKTVSITVNDWNCRIGGEYKGKVSKVLIDAIPSTSPSGTWENGKTRSGVAVNYLPSGSKVKVVTVIFCKTTWYGGGYYRDIEFGRWVDTNTATDWQF